jgi:hypothetical protein
MFSTFLVLLLIFCLYSSLQSIISQLYLNPGTANAPIAVILFLTFNLYFSIIIIIIITVDYGALIISHNSFSSFLIKFNF